MPRLIPTFVDAFEETRADIYFIAFNDYKTGWPMVEQWAKSRGIDADEKMEPIAWPGSLGWPDIGGTRRVWLKFSSEEIDAYAQAFENPDGSSRHVGFACFLFPYSMYLERSDELKTKLDVDFWD